MRKKENETDAEHTKAGTCTSPPNQCRRNALKKIGLGVVGAALGCYGLSRLVSSPRGRTPHAIGPSPGAMQYRINPRNGDKMSLLGYGGMRFPLLPGSSDNTSVDEETTFKLIDYAIEHGVNFFDTAWFYHGGKAGVVLGNALRRHPRSSYLVSDKMPTSANPTPEEAKKIFETQLANTHSDYIDYYLLHAVMTTENYKTIYEENRVLDYILEQKKAGRVRNIGFSFHGDQECLQYLLSRDVDWDIALFQLNCHDLMIEYKPSPFVLKGVQAPPAEPKWILEQMRKTDIPLLVMEPLLGGRLAKMNRKAVTLLLEENPDSSAASWAFRFSSSLPNVMTVLSGMTYMEHLQENIGTFSSYKPLTERELAVLKRALEIYTHAEMLPCTACAYCMPCPYGVNIPAVFFHYNDCVAEERIPKGERSPEYERARRAFLVGYDRSVPELRQAERCTGCNKCSVHCPQKIDIPGEMARIGGYVETLRNRS